MSSFMHSLSQTRRHILQSIHRTRRHQTSYIRLFSIHSSLQNQNQTSPASPEGESKPTAAFAAKRRAIAPDADTYDRTRINTERNEYSQSGTDNAVAAQAAPWDINYHNPEDVRAASYREAQTTEKKVCPLEVSPANQEVSMTTDEGGRGESVVRGPSKRVSPRKGRRVDYGGAVVEEGGRVIGARAIPGGMNE